VANHAFVFD